MITLVNTYHLPIPAPFLSSPLLMDPLLFLLLSFPLHTLSQQQSPMTTNNTPPPPAGVLALRFNAPMAVLIAVLITAFFFVGFFSVYLRNCSTVNRNPSTAPSRAAASRSRRARGLDPSLISSFPTLVYSDIRNLKLGKNALECAVCITDFEDDDTLRLLPYCNHAFHPDCIDTWLSSHTTCPVCRRNLAAPPQQTDSSADLEAPPVLEQQEHITLPVDPTSSAVTTVQEDSGSKRFRVRLWRSRTTTGERMHWPEEERERFTLRLPDHVQRDVFAGKLRRSATIAAMPDGERSVKKGFRDEGSSRGGRSFKLRRESVGRSDRWGFLARPLSFKFTRSSSAAGRTIKLGVGEDSSKGKALASPLDCLGGSASVRRDTSGDEDDQTASHSHSLKPGL